MSEWRSYASDDPKGLRPFLKYQTYEIIKAGYFTEPDEDKAKEILNDVMGRVMDDLANHLEGKEAEGL